MPRVRKLGAASKEEQIKKLFKKALIDKGWTLTHLAELCGKDTGYMSRLINHPFQRQFKDVLMVADRLGIDSIPT